jgi:hypothetical protein
MYQDSLFHISAWIIQHYPDLLKLSDAQRLIRQARSKTHKPAFFLRLALCWLDSLLIRCGEAVDASDDPETLYPYYWGGPWSPSRSSRFNRFM